MSNKREIKQTARLSYNRWYDLYKHKLTKRWELKERLEELLTVHRPKIEPINDRCGVWNDYYQKVESLQLLIEGK